MRKVLLASACIFALSSAGAIAQTPQPGSGRPSSQGNVGPDSSGKMMKNDRATTGSNMMKRDESKGMTPPAGPGNSNSSNPQAGGGAGSGGGR
jgi:hypothetical protein